MHADSADATDLQWLLPILIFAGLNFALFSFSAKYAKKRLYSIAKWEINGKSLPYFHRPVLVHCLFLTALINACVSTSIFDSCCARWILINSKINPTKGQVNDGVVLVGKNRCYCVRKDSLWHKILTCRFAVAGSTAAKVRLITQTPRKINCYQSDKDTQKKGGMIVSNRKIA